MEKKGKIWKCCTDQADQVDPRLVNGQLSLQGESPWQVRGGAAAWEFLQRVTKGDVLPLLGVGEGRQLLQALSEESLEQANSVNRAEIENARKGPEVNPNMAREPRKDLLMLLGPQV